MIVRRTYETVTHQQPAILNGGSVTDCQGNTKPGHNWSLGVPPAETREYVEYEEDVWRRDHSVDRFFSQQRDGRIIMTPYDVGRKITQRATVASTHQRKHWWTNWDSNGSTCCDSFVWSAVSSFVYHRTDEDTKEWPVYGGPRDLDADVNNAVNSTQSAAYSRSFGGADLLTEIGEAQKTVSTVKDLIGDAAGLLTAVDRKVPRQAKGWKRVAPRELVRSSDKFLQAAGRTWLRAIYGILPIAYLIGDVTSLASDKSASYHTYRSQRTIQPGSTAIPPWAPDLYVRHDPGGEIKISSTVKVRYALGALQSIADRVGFNVARTAWELTPFSFVVDWFWNVGNVITSQTSLDLSTERVGCTAIRRSVTDRFSLVDKTEDVYERDYNPDTPCPVQQNETFRYARSVDAIMTSVSEDSYSRFLFARPAARISFDPYVNWRRFVSGLALSYRPIRNALKALS